MLELFVTILPIHDKDKTNILSTLLNGEDAGKLLYAIQYDMFNGLLKNGQWIELDAYFDFIIQAIAYCRDETKLLPDVDEELIAHFENRKVVIQHEIDKYLKKHEQPNKI